MCKIFNGAGKGAVLVKRILIVFLSLCLLISCMAEEGDSETDISSLSRPDNNLDAAFSYAFGYMLGSSLGMYGDNLDYDYTARGVLDAASGSGFYTYEEIQGILSDFQRTRMAEAQDAFEAKRIANKEQSENFLAVNGRRSRVVTTSSGLQYEVLEEGEGREANPSAVVAVNYTLTLLDGTLAFSTYENPEPTVIDLAESIPGFSEGVGLMKEGGRIRLWVPPKLGYGASAPSPIGPDMLLIFDIDLIEVIEE